MRRVMVEVVIAVALVVIGGLLFWGASFANNMVHDQLADQKIRFPAAEKLTEEEKALPNVQQYAGQEVLTGAQAKVYADELIRLHLEGINGGKTYSETSTESRAKAAEAKKAKEAGADNAEQLDTEAKALDAKVQTLFRGETLRGLLLYAYGWWLVGRIAFWVSILMFMAAVLVLVAAFLTRPHHPSASGTDTPAAA